MAAVGDGTYSTEQNRLKLDAGPLSTRALLTELERIATHAKSESLSTEDILAEIADVSPDLAKKLKGVGPWPVVGLILILFWIVKSLTLNLTIDVNWLIDEAWHIAHGEDPEAHLDSDPPKPLQPTEKRPKSRIPLENPTLASAAIIAPNRKARRSTRAKARRAK